MTDQDSAASVNQPSLPRRCFFRRLWLRCPQMFHDLGLGGHRRASKEPQMAMFVHLAPESRIALIRRNGIRRLRRAVGNLPGGVYAVPVTRNFYVSHQWL